MTCDDGAMELADFIHFDDNRSEPYLSLIHVKASKNNAKNRQISIPDYEIVVSQAVKSIRHLSSDNIFNGLIAGMNRKIASAT